MSGALVSAQGLHRRFERPAGAGTHEVLRGASLSLEPGEALAIVGPSGSGKSTLMHLLAGLDVPDSGEVFIGAESMSARDEDGRSALRAKHIGIVLQGDQLLVQCTALENVLLPTIKQGALREDQRITRAKALLESVGLKDFLAHKPAQLSAGQRQRVALARALILSPSLLLADEPTGALDRETSRELLSLLGELREREQIAMIIVTHDEAIAAGLDTVLELRDGVLVPRVA